MATSLRKPTQRWLKAATMAAVLATLGAVPNLQAAPYFGQGFQFSQPDGSKVTLKVWGDEYHRVLETEGGYSVAKNPATGWWEYAVVGGDGTLEPGGVRIQPGSALQAAASLITRTRHLRPSAAAMRKTALASRAAFHAAKTRSFTAPGGAAAEAAASARAAAPAPAIAGNVVALTLLIDFPDDAAAIPQADVDNLLNQSGYTGHGNNGSVHDYYWDVSSNKLNLTSQVFAYYRAQHPKAYYNGNGNTVNGHCDQLLGEALQNWVDNGGSTAGLTFRGGALVSLNFLYAGDPDVGWNNGNTLWPHASGYYFDFGGGLHTGSYEISNIGGSPAISTICHENGHMTCQFPDLYDYTGHTQGVGTFCLMCDAGLATNPLPPCAPLRDQAEWDAVTVLTGASVGATILQASDGLRCARFDNPANANEAFYTEARQRTGRSASLPGDGLLIWHRDLAGNNADPTVSPFHNRVDLEQADGLNELWNNIGSSSQNDMFTAGWNDRFDDASSPNSHWWDGSTWGFGVCGISAAGASMSYVFNGGSCAVPTATCTVTPTRTVTPTFTPTPGLNLEVWNPGQSANEHRLAVRITNYAPAPVALDRLTVKAWMSEPSGKTWQASSYANNQSLYNAAGQWVDNVDAAASVAFAGFGPSDCGAGRKASREVAIRLGSAKAIPGNGGYMATNSDTNTLATWHREDWSALDRSQDYSRLADAGIGQAGRVNDIHFGLFLDGALVCETLAGGAQDPSSGQIPCGLSACGGGGVTPSPTPTQAAATLNLQVFNPGQGANENRLAVRITNWGSLPVRASRLSVKAWQYEPASQSWVGAAYAVNQSIYAADGSWVANVDPASQVTIAIAGTAGSDCGAGRRANREITVSMPGVALDIPGNGGYLATNGDGNSIATWHRADWSAMDRGQDYSRVTEAGSGQAGRSDLKWFALYLDGALVCEATAPGVADANSGQQPCGVSGCDGTHPAPQTASALASRQVDVRTATPGPKLDKPVIVAPNPVHGGELDVYFKASPGQGAFISLANVAGEVVLTADAAPATSENRKATLHVGSVAPGVYLVTVKTGGSCRTVKAAILR